MREEILPYKCSCGGALKKSKCSVEFYGIDFGIKDCEACTSCGSEYLDQEVMKKLEEEVKKRKIFALERNVRVTKSGNSLVIRIPREIAEFLDIGYLSSLRMFPVEKGRLEIEVL